MDGIDEVLAKIGELQECASRLKDAQRVSEIVSALPKPLQAKKSRSSCGDNRGDWLDALRDGLGTIREPLVVLSLFDGIGGTWAALDRLRIPFTGYSCEIDENAVEVLKAQYPSVKHLGSVRDFCASDVPERIDLLVGGFPCQDLSSLGKRMGLHGPKSRLFFDMLRVLHLTRPKWFLVENVASMSWVDREEITKYMRCRPIEVESQRLTASRRRRFYWTNIPHPEKLPDSKVVLQDHLDNAQALEETVGVILSQNFSIGCKAQLQTVYCLAKKEMRYISLTELEKIMGFPGGHTDVAFPCETADDGRISDRAKYIRWSLLGNSFTVPVISYLLSPLLDASVWKNWKAHPFSGKFEEKGCSVMETGEVWALFNEQRQPNWYAVIDKTSGDRFSISSTSKEKKPLKCEIRFLKLHPNYDADDWCPMRGAGIYDALDEVDAQYSWVAFSHKVNVDRVGDSYFIYPRESEIWAIFNSDVRLRTPYFVLVTNSRVTLSKPGGEVFSATCTLLQKVDKELFRCTEVKFESKDLSLFYYSVPYHFVSERGNFKLELNQRSWTHVNDGNRATMSRKRGRKRKRQDGEEDEEEDNDDNDELDEAGNEEEEEPKQEIVEGTPIANDKAVARSKRAAARRRAGGTAGRTAGFAVKREGSAVIDLDLE